MIDLAGLDVKSAAESDEQKIKLAAARLAQEARHAASNTGVHVRDVTEAFVSASKDLRPGQLVKDEYFTLFEAVGALEIMDSKMDSGFILLGESVELDFDPSAGLQAGEALWIMDELMCLEVAWLEGYPLSQTIYTSLHIDRLLSPDNRYPYTFNFGLPLPEHLELPELLTHKILHAYCAAVIKCCSIILEVVQSQNFYEEEDFVTHLFGRELLPKLSFEEILAMLDGATKYLKETKLEEQLKSALQARIAFRRSFMRTIAGETDEWQALIKLVKGHLSDTHDLHHPVPAAFTEKVQRHLATSTPPRPMLETSWKEARTQWTKLLEDIAAIPDFTSFWMRRNPACLQRAMWAFAALNPSTYPRAIMQDILMADGIITPDVPHIDLLLTDIRDMVLAGDPLADTDCFLVEMVSDPRHRCSRLMEAFMDTVIDEYLNLFRMVCQNRSRIRRTFTQAVPLFQTLETVHAAKIDKEIEAITKPKRLSTSLGERVSLDPLTTWTRYYKLQVIAITIYLGFETEIYLPDELGQMYWYLWNILTERRKLIEHIKTFTRERLNHLSAARDTTTYVAECIAAVKRLHVLKAETDADAALAHALWKFFSLLLHLGLIKSPKRAFAKSQLLYEARMKVYLEVTQPAPPSLQEFDRARILSRPVDTVFDEIASDVKEAKAKLALLKKLPDHSAEYIGMEAKRKSEIKRLDTTCVAISVALSQLRRMIEKSGWQDGQETDSLERVIDVSFLPPEKRYHDWWVVPSIREHK